MKRTKLSYYKVLGITEKAKLTKIEREVQTRIIAIKLDAYEIGKFLCEAKDMLSHGSFQDWIESTFADDLPYSTAYFYMKIYKTFKDVPGKVQYIPTKYLTILTQNQFPEETLQLIKEKLEEDPEALKPKQLDKVKALYKLMKEGTIGGNTFEKQAKHVIELGKELSKNQIGRNKHRINRNMRRPMYSGLGDLLERLDSNIEKANQMAGPFPYDPDDPTHQEIIEQIDQTRKKLKKLKIELEGGEGLLKPVSTMNGDQYL